MSPLSEQGKFIDVKPFQYLQAEIVVIAVAFLSLFYIIWELNRWGGSHLARMFHDLNNQPE